MANPIAGCPATERVSKNQHSNKRSDVGIPQNVTFGADLAYNFNFQLQKTGNPPKLQQRTCGYTYTHSFLTKSHGSVHFDALFHIKSPVKHKNIQKGIKTQLYGTWRHVHHPPYSHRRLSVSKTQQNGNGFFVPFSRKFLTSVAPSDASFCPFHTYKAVFG